MNSSVNDPTNGPFTEAAIWHHGRNTFNKKVNKNLVAGDRVRAYLSRKEEREGKLSGLRKEIGGERMEIGGKRKKKVWPRREWRRRAENGRLESV